jgi:hypothetical protein
MKTLFTSKRNLLLQTRIKIASTIGKSIQLKLRSVNKLRALPLLFLICLITFSCQKNPFDERSKLLGDYTFTIHTKGNRSGSSEPIDTIYTYNGKITANEDKDRISIFFTTYLIEHPILYEDWSIKGRKIRGEFNSNKTLTFHLIAGGLGNSTFTNIKGEKKK